MVQIRRVTILEPVESVAADRLNLEDRARGMENKFVSTTYRGSAKDCNVVSSK